MSNGNIKSWDQMQADLEEGNGLLCNSDLRGRQVWSSGPLKAHGEEVCVHHGDEWRGVTLATCQAITGMVVATKKERPLPLAAGSGSHLFHDECEATVGRSRQTSKG